MPDTARKHLLKVFSGPHVGAEVLLGDGEHVLGSGDDCDVILNDQFIAERHVRITVHGDEVTCAAIGDARVYIDGEETGESRLAAFQYFTVGNTHLAIGPTDEPWPHRDFPGFQLNAPAANEPGSGDDQPAGKEQPADTSAAAPNDGATPSTTVGAAGHWTSRHRWIVLATAVFMLAALMGTIFDLARSSEQSAAPEPLTVADVDAVISNDADAANSAVTAVEKDGWIDVSGYVPDGDVKQRLNDALLDLQDAHPEAELDVDLSDMEGLAASARDVLDLYSRKWPELAALQVAPGSPGRIVVAGSIGSSDGWTIAREAIRNDVPHIQELDDSEVDWPGHRAVVQQPEPVPEQQPVASITGNPPETPSPLAPAIEVETPVPEPDPEPFDPGDGPQLSIARVVSIAQRPQLMLTNGAIVFEGARLAGGYIVESIERDQVILSRDGVDHSIALGE